MSFINKEKIFTILREYHETGFPDKLSTPELSKLRAEFGELEDKIISMVVNLVAGKSVFTDASEELAEFQKKVLISPKGDRKEDHDRNRFAAKIAQLNGILSIAKEAMGKAVKVSPRAA